MEELNSKFWNDVIDEVISSDEQIVLSPTSAQSYVLSLNQDIPFNFSQDELNSLFLALENDFPFLKNFYNKKQYGLDKSLSSLEKETLKGLILWLLSTLESWNEQDRNSWKNLTLIFLISSYFSVNFWQFISKKVQPTDSIKCFLSNKISKFGISISIPEDAPIWEKRATSNYLQAIRENNWVYLADHWHEWKFIEIIERPNVFSLQIFLFLTEFSLEELINGLNVYDNFFLLMSFGKQNSYSLDIRFKLALMTKNLLFKFSLIFSLELNVDKNLELTLEQANLFASFLNDIEDMDFLKDLLNLINRYPIRFSFLARGLGTYLAKFSTDERVEIYLQSLRIEKNEVNQYDDSRKILTRTFSYYNQIALSEVKKLFWSKCFSIWETWDLGYKDNDYFLNSINQSNLDYAIVNYYAENLNSSEIIEIINGIEKEVKSIFSTKWFLNKSDMNSYFFNLLSKLQVFCKANELISGCIDIDVIFKNEKTYTFNFFERDFRYKRLFRI
ncbi:hypothetical protein [Acinetobacter guillouiae]|uniref:hypothetical protein n=1 Tax=Acinetobacter guillouiae TaxID=106649 RepID=UPI0032B5239B